MDRTPAGFPESSWSSIWAASPADLWVAGSTAVFHWNGQAWTDRTPPITDSNELGFRQIWGSGPNDVWVIGVAADATGTIPVRVVKRWDGTAWADPPASEALPLQGHNFVSVGGTSAHDVWLVDEDALWHYDGASWSSNALPTGNAYFPSLWTGCPGDVWVAVGSCIDSRAGRGHGTLSFETNRPR